MNRKDDPLFCWIMESIYMIGIIAVPIILRVKHLVEMHLVWYIILCVVLVVINAMTYLPLITACFIVLKLLAKLSLGWGWIVVAIFLDICSAFYVAELRNNNYYQ